MPFHLYDYRDASGNNLFAAWTRTLQTKQLAKLNERLDKLEQHGEELFPDVLSPTANGILKLKVRGNVQLRPLLCRGPVDEKIEYTLLIGAKEISSKLQPKNAKETAQARKAEVAADPNNRRIRHEAVG